MWHLRTRLGVFWVVEQSGDMGNLYRLGLDDTELGVYKEAQDAVRDVCEQSTGHLNWDCSSNIRVPKAIGEWRQGEPDGW